MITFPYPDAGRNTTAQAGAADRAYWVRTMTAIAEPVLDALARRRLKAEMPVRAAVANGGDPSDRARYSHLEAVGRTLAGLAPWLEGSDASAARPTAADEGAVRRRFADLAREAIDAATDPDSPDRVNFEQGLQPIVDAAFLAHALLRAPRTLVEGLSPRVRANLAACLRATRSRKPVYNNWLLFAAMTECGLRALGEDWDRMRVDYALRQHESWYLGDGLYGDGPEYHADYYNSFVIQPMLVDILRAVGDEEAEWAAGRLAVIERARRYSAIQERLIAPDGSFPPIGRSLAYRFGAFQHLSQIALERNLPPSVSAAQTRSALTAVIARTLSLPGNFDERGWLTIGFCGDQEAVGERYISTGSLYLCTTVYLALGLPADDPFWTGPNEPWTSIKYWSGMPVGADHALG